jgi:hypothetical protein
MVIWSRQAGNYFRKNLVMCSRNMPVENGKIFQYKIPCQYLLVTGVIEVLLK